MVATLVSAPLFADDSLKLEGELRFGAVQTDTETTKAQTTLALGGKLSLDKTWRENFGSTITFFTTNALGNQDEEGLFLGSQNQSYSIVGEAYIWGRFANTTLKVGRQSVENPFVNSDDIGMVPNTYQAISLENKSLKKTTLTLLALDKYAGVDSDVPESFTYVQDSHDPLYVVGVVYEGFSNTTLQAWAYAFDDVTYSYFEASYEGSFANFAVQYANQEHSNSAYGVQVEKSFDALSLNASYNKVEGMVSNGLGGGPFFTSSEDHTIADTQDQEALHVGAEYSYNDLTLGASYTDFDKGEDETDIALAYRVTKAHSLELIYSDMGDDGTLTRFFAHYNF